MSEVPLSLFLYLVRTANPQPQTTNPKPHTPTPQPQIPNPKPQTSTPNPKPPTPILKPQTPNSKPQTSEPQPPYRGTSLIRNCRAIGPCSRTMPRALSWSYGGGAVSYERGSPVTLGARAQGTIVKESLSF